jgi:cobalamin biosynthetic protein CobC
MLLPAKPLPPHGGDLALATRLYGKPAGGWLDLSTGINPFAYPLPPAAEADYRRLPDLDALEALVSAARDAYGVPTGSDILALPGTEIAIRLLPTVLDGNHAAIVTPTYGGHARAWPEAATVPSIGAIPDDAIAIVVNPNNPDGRVIAPDELTRLAARVKWLVVDEAFADVAPEASVVPTLARGNTIVLRSFGKFYGLAGLRLGFVIASPVVVPLLDARLGDWPVSGPAIAIGTAALRDARWRDATRARLRDETLATRTVLSGNGFAIVGGTDLFTLVAHDEAHRLYEGLARQGIWTRAFAANPNWLRIGVTDAAGRARFAAALSGLRRG